AFQTMVQSSKLAGAPPAYRIAFRTEGELQDVSSYLRIGLDVLEKQAKEDAAPGEPPNELPKINLLVADNENAEAAVRHGWVELAIHPHGAQWDIIYREESAYAADALRFVERLCLAANMELLRRQLRAARLPQVVGPRLHARSLAEPNTRKTST